MGPFLFLVTDYLREQKFPINYSMGSTMDISERKLRALRDSIETQDLVGVRTDPYLSRPPWVGC